MATFRRPEPTTGSRIQGKGGKQSNPSRPADRGRSPRPSLPADWKAGHPYQGAPGCRRSPRTAPPAKTVPVLHVDQLEARCLPSSSAYVATLYQEFLHRPPSPSEVADWVRVLDAGVSPRYVARGFTASIEYRSDLVTADYGQFLHRAPDAPSLAGFAAALGAGLAPEQLEAILAGSDEYFTLHGRSNDPWLQAVYQDLLDRAPDPGGAGSWTASLQAAASRQDVALAIALSPEALTRTVDTAYEEALGRSTDAAGRSFWVAQLGLGSSSTSIRADLASSPGRSGKWPSPARGRRGRRGRGRRSAAPGRTGP
jgi:Domain of unknown function (DUF4214)